MTESVTALAAQSATSGFGAMTIERRAPRPVDVVVDVLYCGICYTDLQKASNEWRQTVYPIVPGHEIVGRVRAVGSEVTRFGVGDIAAIGCLVDSCRACPMCTHGSEQLCRGQTQTYAHPDKISGGMTYGGYSKAIVVDAAFALKVPASLHGHLAAVAPLLCAGITTFSPMARWKVSAGQKMGVLGLGGLGHMAVKFGVAMGAEVTVFDVAPQKIADAARLGAKAAVNVSNMADVAPYASSFDFILDAVPADHDVNAYLNLLKPDGVLVMVGMSPKPVPISTIGIILGRRVLTGSLIGGLAETQDMLDFCGQHGIFADIEMVAAKDVDAAFERLRKSDVKYRFVIDLATL